MIENNNLIQKMTFLPRIWLMAADSLRVHSSMTRCRFSFMKSMNALSGFLTYSRRLSWDCSPHTTSWWREDLPDVVVIVAADLPLQLAPPWNDDLLRSAPVMLIIVMCVKFLDNFSSIIYSSSATKDVHITKYLRQRCSRLQLWLNYWLNSVT